MASLCQQVQGVGTWGRANTRSRVKKRGPGLPVSRRARRGEHRDEVPLSLLLQTSPPPLPVSVVQGSAPPRGLQSVPAPGGCAPGLLSSGAWALLFPLRRTRAGSRRDRSRGQWVGQMLPPLLPRLPHGGLPLPFLNSWEERKTKRSANLATEKLLRGAAEQGPEARRPVLPPSGEVSLSSLLRQVDSDGKSTQPRKTQDSL